MILAPFLDLTLLIPNLGYPNAGISNRRRQPSPNSVRLFTT
jgi:hypothetical protein